MHLALAVVVLLVLGLVAGCGTETGPVDDRRPASEGEWRHQTLTGTPGADAPTVLAASGEDALVVMLSDEGVLQSWRSVGGADFEQGVALRTGWEYAGLAGAVRHDGDWIVLGSGGLVDSAQDEELTFTPRSFGSDDGLTWQELHVEGIAGPVDVSALVEVDGTLVAAGAHRGDSDPASGGFRPAVWRSDDGESWTEVELPDVVNDGDSYVGDLAVSGDRVIAVGRTDGHGMLWASDDAGATWRASDQLRDTHYLARVGVAGDVLLASGEADGGSIFRSTDGGHSWSAPAEMPFADDVEGYASLWSAADGFLVATEPSLDALGRPELCYADVEQCRPRETDMSFWASGDGDSWSPVDLAVSGDELTGAVATESGRLLLAEVVIDGVAVHEWPAGVELPPGDEPTSPRTVDLVTVPEDEEPDVGVRYHAPLYIHCGMEWLYLGKTSWRRVDGGPDVETGAGDAPPASWPVAWQTIYGYATLTGGGVVEYSIGQEPDEAEVIATYQRANGSVGCD